MKDKIRFGIIGLSRVAKKNAIPALLDSQNAEAVMIGSRTAEKAHDYAQENGIGGAGSYEDVIAHPDIDAVYISLPNGLHEEWAVKAANAGKHVWCEKPAALSYESAQRMIRAARENNVRIIEGFSFLFHPQHAEVLSLINDGVLGEVLSFDGTFVYPMPEKGNIRLDPSLGGGSYADAAVYPIRASRMIFREEPLSISCNLTVDPELGVDVKANIELMYSNARTARISSGFGEDYQSTYSVTGNTAFLKTERAYAVPPDRAVHLYLESGASKTEISIAPADQFVLMIDDFCKQILLGAKSDKNYEDDLLQQARVLDAGQLSYKKGRAVNLSEVG